MMGLMTWFSLSSLLFHYICPAQLLELKHFSWFISPQFVHLTELCVKVYFCIGQFHFFLVSWASTWYHALKHCCGRAYNAHTSPGILRVCLTVRATHELLLFQYVGLESLSFPKLLQGGRKESNEKHGHVGLTTSLPYNGSRRKVEGDALRLTITTRSFNGAEGGWVPPQT